MGKYTPHKQRMYVKFATAADYFQDRADEHMDRAIEAAEHGDSKTWAKEHHSMIEVFSGVQRLQRYAMEYLK